MKHKLLLFVFILLAGAQMMAANLVLFKLDDSELMQDIAAIGRWVFVGKDLQLISHDGAILAQEPITELRKIIFSTTTTLENVKSSNSILVYPNPTQDILLINGIEAQLLRVFDMQGRLLVTENGTQVNVSSLPIGTYLLQVGTHVVRFIKQD